MQIQHVILELLHTFYFSNICDITDESRFKFFFSAEIGWSYELSDQFEEALPKLSDEFDSVRPELSDQFEKFRPELSGQFEKVRPELSDQFDSPREGPRPESCESIESIENDLLNPTFGLSIVAVDFISGRLKTFVFSVDSWEDILSAKILQCFSLWNSIDELSIIGCLAAFSELWFRMILN